MPAIGFNIVDGEYVIMSSDFNRQFASASEQMKEEHQAKQSSVVKKAFAYMRRPTQILKNCIFNQNEQ